MKYGREAALPLPIPTSDGGFTVVMIPRMTESEFVFFMNQLDVYRECIVVPEPASEADALKAES